MSWFKLKDPIGTNYRVDKNDLMNTKRALNQLGYYNIPAHRGIDDWTDDIMFPPGIVPFRRKADETRMWGMSLAETLRYMRPNFCASQKSGRSYQSCLSLSRGVESKGRKTRMC